MKGQVYEGGTLVPGLIEWPARIPQPRSTSVRATTSDLMPTLCAITEQPLPDRPIDLTPVLDGKMTNRSKPLYFWSYNTSMLVQRVYMAHLGGSMWRCHHPIGSYKLAGLAHLYPMSGYTISCNSDFFPLAGDRGWEVAILVGLHGRRGVVGQILEVVAELELGTGDLIPGDDSVGVRGGAAH